ncbi:MAG: ABC transporter ATP-binding protein [Lachnospirales bacterium]
MLTVKDLNVYYGSIHAIKGISFNVNKGEIVSLIGANGAGKTTTLHAISGLIQPESGSVEFLDKNFVNIAPHKIVYEKMAHVPEGRRIFTRLTVEENLDLGAFSKEDEKRIEENFKRVYKMFPRLKERRNQISGTLSGGEQQMLAIGRALMSDPEMLLMDEPSMGLAPLLVQEIFKIVKKCNDEGMTILLVEQNANLALRISDRAYVLETGKVVLEGTGAELLENKAVKKAYLGG